MYSMPNGAQEQAEDGEASGGESEEEWQSDGEGEEDDDDSSEDEEEEVDPPHSERRSKLAHDPANERGKANAPIGQSSKRPRMASPAPTEKAPKQPKSSKPPKALPKMRMTVPTISG